MSKQSGVENALAWTIAVAAFLVLFLAIMNVSAAILWMGWNWLVVPAFHAPHATYLQCLAAGFIFGVLQSMFNRGDK